MDLNKKLVALMAMRSFVRGLPADQAHLFHQIAARYQGTPEEFRETVIREFREGAGARPSAPTEELELRSAMSYALGRESAAVLAMVETIKSAWPDLGQPTRDHITSAIETAINYRMAGGAPEIALWKQILVLASENRLSLEELRGSAAQAAFEAHDFGELEVEDISGWEFSTRDSKWTRAVYLTPDTAGGPSCRAEFTVVFESDTAVIKEAYASLNGEILQPRASYGR
ncbi:hypothetical protein ACVIGB_000719 [Bradyrhizobium sp. USDA 4341]